MCQALSKCFPRFGPLNPHHCLNLVLELPGLTAEETDAQKSEAITSAGAHADWILSRSSSLFASSPDAPHLSSAMPPSC